MTIDKNTPIPLYYQLKQILTEQIDSNQYACGEAIPTEQELCEMYNISRTTVRQAVTELVQEGKLKRSKGKGTFVSLPIITTDLNSMWTSYNENVVNMNMAPEMHVISVGLEPLPEKYEKYLEIPAGTKVICLRRNQRADGKATNYIKSYLVYPDADQVMDIDAFKTQSLYTLLASRENTRIGSITRYISTRVATENDVNNLKVNPGTAVLIVASVGFSLKTGKPIVIDVVKYPEAQNILTYKFELADSLKP